MASDSPMGETCHFCGKHAPDNSCAVTIRMFKPAKAVDYEATYDTARVAIPRCEHCAKFHGKYQNEPSSLGCTYAIGSALLAILTISLLSDKSLQEASAKLLVLGIPALLFLVILPLRMKIYAKKRKRFLKEHYKNAEPRRPDHGHASEWPHQSIRKMKEDGWLLQPITQHIVVRSSS